jgi:hypothetical protein
MDVPILILLLLNLGWVIARGWLLRRRIVALERRVEAALDELAVLAVPD